MSLPARPDDESPRAPTSIDDGPVVADPWRALKRFTPARIALGRSGISLPTVPLLAFQLAHAQARDAVHRRLDAAGTTGALEALGLEVRQAHSAAADRQVYLQRPDLGRRLGETSAAELRARRPAERCDLALVVADGLSALAIERHAAPFLAALLGELGDNANADADANVDADSAAARWRIGPAVLVQQARVAIGDEIGELLGADLVLVLIGERPGLSSPDSLGLYLTWSPRTGRSDAERNCISNVRPEGQPYSDAARRCAHLLRAARSRRLSGVALKDESTPVAKLESAAPGFVLGR